MLWEIVKRTLWKNVVRKTLWNRSCDIHVDVVRKMLCERSCETDDVSMTLWKIRWEKDVVRKTLWERRYEKDVMRKMLWERCCEKDVMRKTLWERYYEKDVVRKTLWERWEKDVVKKIKNITYCFDRHILVNVCCICCGLCISDVFVFSSPDHAKSNIYWKSTGDRRPLASSFQG